MGVTGGARAGNGDGDGANRSGRTRLRPPLPVWVPSPAPSPLPAPGPPPPKLRTRSASTASTMRETEYLTCRPPSAPSADTTAGSSWVPVSPVLTHTWSPTERTSASDAMAEAGPKRAAADGRHEPSRSFTARGVWSEALQIGKRQTAGSNPPAFTAQARKRGTKSQTPAGHRSQMPTKVLMRRARKTSKADRYIFLHGSHSTYHTMVIYELVLLY